MGGYYICCLSTSCMHRLLHGRDRQHSPGAQQQSRNEQYLGDLVLWGSGHHSTNIVPFTLDSQRLPSTRSHWAFPLAHMPGILLRLYRAKRMQAWIISLLITRFQRLALLHDSNLLLCGWARTCFTEESARQNPLCGDPVPEGPDILRRDWNLITHCSGLSCNPAWAAENKNVDY